MAYLVVNSEPEFEFDIKKKKEEERKKKKKILRLPLMFDCKGHRGEH